MEMLAWSTSALNTIGEELIILKMEHQLPILFGKKRRFNRITSFFYITLLISISISVAAQKPTGLQLSVKIKGKNKPLAAAWVDIEHEGSFVTTSYPNEKGMFTYLFEYDGIYKAVFNAHGFFPKTLEIDTRFVPDFDKVNLHDWEVGEIALIKSYDKANPLQLDQPVGRIHYDTSDFDFTIDYSFTLAQQREVKKLADKVEVLETEQVAYEKTQKQTYDSILSLGKKYAQLGLNAQALDMYTLAGMYLPERSEYKEHKQELLAILRNDSVYELKLASARKNIEKGDYRAAHEDLLYADNIKPRQIEVKKLMARTSVAVQANEERQNRFNNLMYLGEAAISGENYKQAVGYYMSALEIEPDALLAKKKLTEAQILQAQQEEQRSRARLLQARKDSAAKYLQQARLLRFKDIDAAREKAEKALQIPTGDSLLMASANEIIEDWHKKEQERHNKEKFNNYLTQSVDAQNRGDYEVALLAVNEALLIYPGEKEAIENKRDIESALKKAGLEKNFKALCASGQAALEKGNLIEARKYYSGAIALRPKDALPRRQIQSIDMQLATLDHKAREEHMKQSPATTQQDSLFRLDKTSEAFRQALAIKYPEGVTEELIEDERKTTIRRIVVIGNSGAEYLKVKHVWGGLYYFKNGTAVPEYIWEKETNR
jgi:hypothetical protein